MNNYYFILIYITALTAMIAQKQEFAVLLLILARLMKISEKIGEE